MFVNVEIDRAKREGCILSLLMIDVDDFKNINDTYGHQEGDKVLNVIGQTVITSVRKHDIAARFGGEEIVVLLPRIKMERTHTIANRVEETFIGHLMKMNILFL